MDRELGPAPEMESDNQSDGEPKALWSISAVSRSTGLSTHTLRAWERRFGIPTPVRLSSKHRRYTQTQVEHLQLVARALSQGHRAGDVVPLPAPKLRELLSLADPIPSSSERRPEWLSGYYEKILAYDREQLNRGLIHEASQLGVRQFLYERVLPLVQAIGLSWKAGELQVRHEHFATEILQDVLRHLRMGLEAPSQKQTILLATLPQEHHALGLQIVALLLALHRYPLHLLGPRTPVEDLLAACETLRPGAVGLSVTLHSANEQTAQELHQLRLQLPDAIPVWLGGSGAPYINPLPLNVQVFPHLEDFERKLQP